eukprot:scaffold8609_cov101-Skeletonema_marinoi.AAC.3
MDQAIADGAADEENALLSVLRQEQQQSMQQMEERLRQLLIDNNQNENPKKKPISASSYGTERSPDMAADDQYYTMVEDIYSIMCVSPARSQPFVYATTIFLVKILFYLLILSSIFIKATIFPTEVEDLVKATQFFMLPITVLVTDSGVLTAMFIYAHLKWSPEIEAQNQLATKRRYIYANIARSVDAVLYQVVIFFVLLQATEVLAVFLNFAALRFFMEIHTVAFEVARNGFLSVPLYKAAADVRRIQIKATICYSTQRTARIFFVVSLTVMCVGWFLLSVVY